MNLKEIFPYMAYVNLGYREDRRRTVEKRFEKLGLEVDRQPGVRKERVKDCWGFRNASRYACSLAKRMAIRRAKLAGAPAMMLFEDDVVLADDLHERMADIELPDNWGIFFLGCKHIERPVPLAENLLRVTRATDNHAIGIRAEYYDAVIRALGGTGKGRPPSILYSDANASFVQRTIPSYAAFPNLAWQAFSHSDNEGMPVTYYDINGRQRNRQAAVDGLEEEIAAKFPGKVKAEDDDPIHSETPMSLEKPLSQVTASHENVPAVYSFREIFPLRFYLNRGCDEEKRIEMEYQLLKQRITADRLAVSGNSRAGGSSRMETHRIAVRMAIQSRSPALWVIDDRSILAPEFRRLVEGVPVPDNWGLLFFNRGEEMVTSRLAWEVSEKISQVPAYAVCEPFYGALLEAMAGKADDELVGVFDELRKSIPCYMFTSLVVSTSEDVSVTMFSWVREFLEARDSGMPMVDLPHPDLRQSLIDQFGIDVFALAQ